MAALFASEETIMKSGSLNSIEPTQHHAIDMPITSDGSSQPPVSPNLTQDEASGDSGGIPDESVGISPALRAELRKAVEEDKSEVVMLIVEKDEKLVTTTINDLGNTALDIAAYRGHTPIVQYLLTKMKADDLKPKNSSSNTALASAARVGNVEIAKILVDKDKTLLDIESTDGKLPLHEAAANGRRDMVKFLYERMKGNDLWTSENRGRVLLACVQAELFDIAQEIATDHPELAVSTCRDILEALACNPDAFRIKKHSVLAYFLKPKIDACDGHVDEGNQAVMLLRTILNCILKPEAWLTRGLADQIIEVEKLEETPQNFFSRVSFEAVKKGNTAFLAVLIDEHPKVLSELNDNKQNLFHYAVLYRRAGIFNLLNSNKDPIMHSLKNGEDKNRNILLHFVGMLEEIMRSNQWQDLKEPDVQMVQEEIWFKMVSDILPSSLRKKKNKDGLTPKELFTKNHRDLFLKAVDSEKKKVSGYFSPGVSILLMVAASTVNQYHNETGLFWLLTMLLHGMAFLLAFIAVLNTWKISDYAVDDFKSLRSKGNLTIIQLEMAVVLLLLSVASTYLIKDPYIAPITVVMFSFVYWKIGHHSSLPDLEKRTKLA